MSVVSQADSPSMSDVINFFNHIGYISAKANSQRFVDSAHAKYDLAV